MYRGDVTIFFLNYETPLLVLKTTLSRANVLWEKFNEIKIRYYQFRKEKTI